MADITPRPHVLLSLASQNLTWPKALGELIDNAFDNAATRVVITTSKAANSVTVEDDGNGVRDVLSLVTLGYHDPSNTNSIGMYGIGAKDAWAFTGGEILIDTVRNGVRTVLNFDGRKQENWNCADPVNYSCTAANGTTLTLPLHDRNQPSNEVFERLSFIFTPALSRGLQIIRSLDKKPRELLKPWKLPMLQDIVHSHFDIDGKHVEIEIGILQAGERMKNGPFWLQYDNRNIDSTSLGAGQYSTMRVAGVIRLGKGWTLTKNKDDLTEKNKERLADAIFARIESVLKKAEAMAEDIESQALRNELETWLNQSLATTKRKQKRCEGTTTGSVSPVGTSRTIKRAAKVHESIPGNCELTSPVGRKRGFTLDWCEDDAGIMGRFDASGSRVHLNVLHPFIAYAKQSNNRVAYMSAAFALISDYASTHKDNNKLLQFEWSGFADAFSQLTGNFAQGVKANEPIAKAN